jgi:hypothetical protein
MPRAYWLGPNDHTLAVHVLLLQPSESEFNRVMAAVSDAGSSEYDMEILNRLYNTTAQILPHRGYALLTGEFRLKSHSDYLGNGVESFDPEKILQETKYLHFSDWPASKVILYFTLLSFHTNILTSALVSDQSSKYSTNTAGV